MKIRSAMIFAGAISFAMWAAAGRDCGGSHRRRVHRSGRSREPARLRRREPATRGVQGAARFPVQCAAQARQAPTPSKQQVAMQFQQELTDKQREIVGPLFQRAQLAIAAVSATRNLSIVVDKRIVIYGGQDITKDVEAVFSSSQAISAAGGDAAAFGNRLRRSDGARSACRTYKRRIARCSSSKRRSGRSTRRGWRRPAPPATNSSSSRSTTRSSPTSRISCSSRSSNRRARRPPTSRARRASYSSSTSADVIYGGTDITADVQNALTK